MYNQEAEERMDRYLAGVYDIPANKTQPKKD